eukprot:271971_1
MDMRTILEFQTSQNVRTSFKKCISATIEQKMDKLSDNIAKAMESSQQILYNKILDLESINKTMSRRYNGLQEEIQTLLTLNEQQPTQESIQTLHQSMHAQDCDIADLKAVLSELKESYQERQQQMESNDLSDSIWHQRITEQYVAHSKELDVLSRLHHATHKNMEKQHQQLDRMYALQSKLQYQPRLEQQVTKLNSQSTVHMCVY